MVKPLTKVKLQQVSQFRVNRTKILHGSEWTKCLVKFFNWSKIRPVPCERSLSVQKIRANGPKILFRLWLFDPALRITYGNLWENWCTLHRNQEFVLSGGVNVLIYDYIGRHSRDWTSPPYKGVRDIEDFLSTSIAFWFFHFLLADFDECVRRPCSNGALCVNTMGSFKCSCRAGFTGKLCDQGKPLSSIKINLTEFENKMKERCANFSVASRN